MSGKPFQVEYTYLLTNQDLNYIVSMVGMLSSAIEQLCQKRQLAGVEELDCEPCDSEVDMHMTYHKMTGHRAGLPRDDDDSAF